MVEIIMMHLLQALAAILAVAGLAAMVLLALTPDEVQKDR